MTLLTGCRLSSWKVLKLRGAKEEPWGCGRRSQAHASGSVGSAVGAAFWLSTLGTGRERSLYEVLLKYPCGEWRLEA